MVIAGLPWRRSARAWPTSALCDDVASGDPLEFDDELDRAVRSFQQERGITVDGIVGPHTFRRLDESRWQLGDRVLSYVPGHLMAGDDVTELQRRLNTLGFASGRTDGIFGVQTDAALREFQKGVGVNADGTCGPDTFRAFDRLVRTISGGNAASLREHVTLSELQTGVADKVVVLDPGDTVDADLCHAIAVRVEGRLAALGTQVLLTRPAHRDPVSGFPDDPARAAFANETGADLVVSLHVDRVASPLPNGLVTFYFGDPRGGTHSHQRTHPRGACPGGGARPHRPAGLPDASAHLGPAAHDAHAGRARRTGLPVERGRRTPADQPGLPGRRGGRDRGGRDGLLLAPVGLSALSGAPAYRGPPGGS